MTPREFVKTYRNYAETVQKTDKVPALFCLAQSALETAWGEKCPGNMMFGIKDTDGVNGNEQLITTTEYHTSARVKYPVIISIVEVLKDKRWKYAVKDWFRKYPSPEDSFRDYARFLKGNQRYRQAFTYAADPYLFGKEICKAGYATAPDYWVLMEKVMKMIEREGVK